MVEAILSTSPKKGRTGKRKTKNSGHPSDAPDGAKNTCLLHSPGHSLEECKVLKFYSEKYASRSGGKPKCGKTVELDDNTQEVNTMKNRGDTIPRKKSGKKWLPKSARSKA